MPQTVSQIVQCKSSVMRINRVGNALDSLTSSLLWSWEEMINVHVSIQEISWMILSLDFTCLIERCVVCEA